MPITLKGKNLELIPHNCLIRLQAIYDSLKSAEKKAADLLLDRPDFVSEASIIEAAGAAGCSEATLVRLARKLGYCGYPELKACLHPDNRQNPIPMYAGVTAEDSCETVAEKVFEASIQALHDTLEAIDRNEYRKAVDAVADAGSIVFCGAGDAANVALSGFQKFVRTGAHVYASPDPDIQLITVSHLKKKDVVIAISHSGRTKSVVDVVKYAKAAGVTVICITNFPVSPLAKNSDIVLLTAAFAEHLKGEVMSKRVAELCLLESLFVNVLLKKGNTCLEGLKRSNDALEVNKL